MTDRVTLLARLEALLKKKHGTTKEIAEEMHMSCSNVAKLMHILRMQDRAHVARKIRGACIYGPGPQINPAGAAERILANLTQYGPAPARGIAPALGLSQHHVQDVISESLHGSGVYVFDWLVEGSHRIAVYAAGSHPDKARPAPLTHTEASRRRRAAIYKDPDRHQRQIAKWRAARIKPARDPMVEALFGSKHQEATNV